MMTDLMMWDLIVGFAAPMVIATLTQENFRKWVRVAIMLGVSVVLGAGTAFFTGQFEGADVVTSVLTVAVAAIASYKGLFKPTGAAKKVEAKTTPKKKRTQGGKHAAP